VIGRAERFRAIRAADPAAELDRHLPPVGARLRPFVLVELIAIDMEWRARAGHPIRLEDYLSRFPNPLPDGAVLVPLLVEEYRLRSRYAVEPELGEFRRRFPDQFDAFREALRGDGKATIIPGSSLAPGLEHVDLTPADVFNQTRSATPVVIQPPRGREEFPAELTYKLKRSIGKGAFGEVFLAEAPGGVAVALKQIHRPMAHPASQGEIEALDAVKSLSHPYLVKTHAYWVAGDRLNIVMELADESLADRIKFHQMLGFPGVPAEELVPIFEQAAEGLDYLHAQHVTHRDVKPENVLLTKGYAKVADFGLARLQKHDVTVVGHEMGTAAYMAPEVWNCKISRHSDQYSLAGTYVTARLGHPPFTDPSILRQRELHLGATPDLTALPAPERKVLLRAMAKNCDKRYPNCAAFAEALKAAVLDGPPPARSRWGAVAAALVAAVLCGVVAGVVILRLQPPREPVVKADPAERPAPAAPACWCPDGWEPDAEGGTATVSGKEYHKRLKRTVDGEELVAILIPRKGASDPPTFYMLEDKITNRVFRYEWERAARNPRSPVSEFQRGTTLRNQLLPGEWRRGAEDRTTRTRLGIDGARADGPVVGVTVPEAILVAQELGGLLPDYQQWAKAVGQSDGGAPGPTGPEIEIPATVPDRGAFARDELRKRGLALGRDDGPAPVKQRTADVSRFGIHQLLSNGEEWTGETQFGGRMDLLRLPSTKHKARLVGWPWWYLSVLTFDALSDQDRAVDWDRWEQYAGFRLVLEPP
jgi:hypothetical protein